MKLWTYGIAKSGGKNPIPAYEHKSTKNPKSIHCSYLVRTMHTFREGGSERAPAVYEFKVKQGPGYYVVVPVL